MDFNKREVLDNIKSGHKRISLYGDINDSDAAEIAEALKSAIESASKNNTELNLNEISFEKSKISCNGLKLITRGLSLFPNLQKVSFDFCFVQRNGALYIMQLLLANKNILGFSFARNCSTEECWLELVRDAGIVNNECNSWIEIFAPVLFSNKNIKYADLSCGVIDDNAADLLAAAIRHNKFLKSLDISYSKISSANMKKICLAIDANNSLNKICAQFCGDPKPHFADGGIEAYEFHKIASETLKNETKLQFFEDIDIFDDLNRPKKKRVLSMN